MQMWNYTGGVPFASSIQNGPFRAEVDPHRKRPGKNRWRVLNRHRNRVFRGSEGAAKRRANRLNEQYAHWLMTKED